LEGLLCFHQGKCGSAVGVGMDACVGVMCAQRMTHRMLVLPWKGMQAFLTSERESYNVHLHARKAEAQTMLHLSDTHTWACKSEIRSGAQSFYSTRIPKGFELGRGRCTWPASPSAEEKANRIRTCRIHIRIPLILVQTVLRVRVRGKGTDSWIGPTPKYEFHVPLRLLHSLAA
jgi:hypothetical protein